ncbi:AAA domain-containing protein [Nitrosococcus watsonii]|uniref:AAA domain-containing protein n=1 Tax=Nitrosococcus watsonii TaxID=473531 RepID=UPI001E3D7B09|nr:AAA domain-containing protein [Nitrosococcus watsonii]
MNFVWPDAALSSERFAQLVGNEAKASKEERLLADKADDHVADLLANHSSATIENIRDAFASFQDVRRRLMATSHSWMKEALRDILSGHSSLWRELFRVTDHIISAVEGLVASADNTSIEFLEPIDDIRVLHEDARRLKEHLESGGKLGWGPIRPKQVKERLYVIKSVQVGGRPCSTIEHFSLLADVLHVDIECEKAWQCWTGQSDKIQGLYVLQLTTLKSLRGALEKALSLQSIIDKCRNAVQACPALEEPLWNDESQIERIIALCRLALARIRKRLAAAELQGIETPVSQIAATDNAHPVTMNVLGAIQGRERDEFAQCVSKIQDLEKQRQYLLKQDENLSRLRWLLPQLADCLERTCNEPYWEERSRHIGDAWHWAQARCWIEDYIRQADVPALGKRVKQIEDTINDIIAELASLHAWSFCFSRLTESHRRHMGAWQQSMGRLGKGTGKHAPHHRREAQGHLHECREAVPAWVMPLHRIWDMVSPTPGMFDVIIVDEASQCGFEALPLLYLGKKVVIVGDDKQISPETIGLSRDTIHCLMEEFLYDFRFKSSFDVESSLFDHGKLRYGTQRITLREHFRCMPEIIRFSNDLCYSDTPLIPLRQYKPDRLPPLEHVFVPGGYREGSNNRTINRPEADAIVTRIAELCEDSRYDSKSMGVVVLQGEAQATLIEGLLLERLGAEEMERRRLICGNSYNFQGDERDIMFLSLVAAANKRIGPLTKPADKRRFNVAASRARDKMILFYSVTVNDLRASCYRRRLLEFFANTQPQQIAGIERDELERRAAQDNRRIVSPPVPFDSWFEVEVALELLRKEFRILPQHEVAGRRIDLVVEGGQARLAVECDGDHWHGADRYEADMQRQRQLERCGWEFFRVRESAFYANKDDALAGLWRMLEEREIFPSRQHKDLDPEIDMEKEDCDEPHSEASKADHARYSLNNLEKSIHSSGRRAEEITPSEIENAILQALWECPNQSCTLDSLTARVLKEVGVRTRGKPWKAFKRRTLQSASLLERRGRIETYKAKNQRLRLVHQETA